MLIFFKNCIKYYNTIKYLRLVQIIGQIKYRLLSRKNYKFDHSKDFELNQMANSMISPAKRNQSMVDANTFIFLNETHSISINEDWDNTNLSKLWLYNLHYFDDLNALDSHLRLEWHKDLISSWLDHNLPDKGVGWDPYPTSLRIVNWIKWHLIICPLEEQAAQSLLVQVRFLHNNLETHLLGNHLFSNAKALIFAGLFFNHFESKKWYEKGLKIISRELSEQILEDGGSFELSTMYHVILLEDLLDILNIHFTFEEKIPANLTKKINLMYSWLSTMCHPDFEISFFNDSAFNIAPSFIEIRDYISRLNEKKLLDIDTEKQAEKSFVDLNSSGYSRIESDDMVLLIDRASIGPDYQPGHAHADTFSFELSLFNKRVVVNSGTSTYERNIERHRQRSTSSHSTVVIDQENSSEIWGAFRVARRAKVSNKVNDIQKEQIILSASHSGYHRLYGKPTHSRSWKYFDRLLEITDIINGQGVHDIDLCFPLHPEVKIITSSRQKVLIKSEDNEIEINFKGNGSLVVEKSTYHPEFGLSIENKKLHYKLSKKIPVSIITRIHW